MIKTYSFRIRHDHKHRDLINSIIGSTRFVYNLAKDAKEQNYKKGKKLSNYDLQKQLTQCKHTKGFEWLNNTPAQTLQASLDRLDRAYKSFFKGGGYPKWASNKKWKSAVFKSVKQPSHNTFKLPKLGCVTVFNPKQLKGKLKRATIVREVDGYYLKIQVEKEEKYVDKKYKDVAIDRGIKNFIVTSDGEYTENPKINAKTEKRLRILNRKLSRAKKGSKKRLKVIEQLRKLYLKRRRQRTDFLHKLTTKIASEYQTVYLEDLKTSKMVQDRKYSKAISDLGWYMFEKLLSYKTKVEKINPAFTSQKCSNCGHTSKDNRKTQEKFKCVKCEYEEEADFQATKNILKRGRADLCNAKVGH